MQGNSGIGVPFFVGAFVPGKTAIPDSMLLYPPLDFVARFLAPIRNQQFHLRTFSKMDKILPARSQRFSPTIPVLFLLLLHPLAASIAAAAGASATLPERALWFRSAFFRTTYDTMSCVPAQSSSGESGKQVICTGLLESKRFTCDLATRLPICSTKIAYVTTNKVGEGPSAFVTSSLHNQNLSFFVDSTRMLRYIRDPVIGSYLSSDSLSHSYYRKFLKDGRYTQIASGVQLVGALGFIYFLMANRMTADAPTITTGSLFAGGYAGVLYFSFDGKQMFDKAIATFRSNQ